MSSIMCLAHYELTFTALGNARGRMNETIYKKKQKRPSFLDTVAAQVLYPHKGLNI